MRIGIDARLAQSTGGIGRYTYDLVRSLGRYGRKHAYAVLVDATQDTSWIPASVEKIFFHTRQKRWWPIMWEHLYFPRRILAKRFDLVHFPHLSVPLGYSAPFVTTAHDISIYQHPEWFPRGQWFSTGLVVPRALRRARKILVVSSDVADQIHARFHIDPRRMTVIPNGVDDEKFIPGEHLTRDYLLYVGSAAPYKNIALLNAVVARAGKPCVVIGASQEEFAWALGRTAVSAHFTFLPKLDFASPELIRYYQNARGLLQPSLSESFALPILEALACGTPVVASDIPSLRAVYGTAVHYAALGDIDAWQGQIEQLPASVASGPEAVRATVIPKFSWRTLVAELEMAYQSVGV